MMKFRTSVLVQIVSTVFFVRIMYRNKSLKTWTVRDFFGSHHDVMSRWFSHEITTIKRLILQSVEIFTLTNINISEFDRHSGVGYK